MADGPWVYANLKDVTTVAGLSSLMTLTGVWLRDPVTLRTSLHLAARFGETDLCDQILFEGKELANISCKNNRIPLYEAISFHNSETAFFLADFSPSLSNQENCPLRLALTFSGEPLIHTSNAHKLIVQLVLKTEPSLFSFIPLARKSPFMLAYELFMRNQNSPYFYHLFLLSPLSLEEILAHIWHFGKKNFSPKEVEKFKSRLEAQEPYYEEKFGLYRSSKIKEEKEECPKDPYETILKPASLQLDL